MSELAHQDYLQRLVVQLASLPTETEWVEFKMNNAAPQEIGEYVSALSNSATLCEKPAAYIVWGINDSDHEIAGTSFDYRRAKKGNQELEGWLLQMVNPKLDLRFREQAFVIKRSSFWRFLQQDESPPSLGQPPMYEWALARRHWLAFPIRRRGSGDC